MSSSQLLVLELLDLGFLATISRLRLSDVLVPLLVDLEGVVSLLGDMELWHNGFVRLLGFELPPDGVLFDLAVLDEVAQDLCTQVGLPSCVSFLLFELVESLLEIWPVVKNLVGVEI